MAFIKGVVSAMITPLKEQGQKVDLDIFKIYCDFLISKNVQGLFICGTTGEGPLLTLEERKKMAETAVGHINGRVKVIIHTGCITTLDTIKLTKHAEEIGANGAGIVLPFFYPIDEEAIFNHYVTIAQAVPSFPLLVYNIPQCTVNNLTPRTVLNLFEKVDNIVGIKTSSADLEQLQNYLQLLAPEKILLCGHDRFDLAALSSGADGIVSGNASAFPEPFVNLYHYFEQGNMQKAKEEQIFINRMAKVLREGGCLDYFKKSLAMRGVDVGDVRAPNRTLTTEEEVHLRAGLQGLSLI